MTVETTMPLANSVEIVSSTTTNVAEAIRLIHQGETSGTTPFYNATAESVARSPYS